MWPKRRSLIQSENLETLYPKARRLEGISRPRSNSRTKDIEAEMDVSLFLSLLTQLVSPPGAGSTCAVVRRNMLSWRKGGEPTNAHY